MPTKLLLSALIVCFHVVSCAAFEDTRNYGSVDLGSGKTLPYSYILPDNYNSDKEYPVVLGLGSDDPREGPSFFFRSESLAKNGWIIVESGAYFAPDPTKATRKLLDHLRTKFKVEGNRFYTIGYSANSSTVFSIVLALPDYYQGMIAVPGHPSSTDPATLTKLKNTKIKFLVGGDDGYWLKEAESAHKRMKELGIETTIEIFPGKGHVLRELIGDGMLKQFNAMR